MVIKYNLGMEHYIITDSQKNTSKIQRHLSKYINVHSPAWILTNGTFNLLQFHKFSKKITRYQITSLILTNNTNPTLLTSIGGGTFEYLLILHLSNNSIKNIEVLQFFQMPCLEALYLDRNLLVNLRALRKVIGARLKILDLSMNHLVELEHLQELYCPKIKQLSLHCNVNVGHLLPLMKAQMNPATMTLHKMNVVGAVAKKIYIDTCWRGELDGNLPRTRI